MSYKSIRGNTNSITYNISNTDINASWLSVTADTVTANNTLYVNTMDVEASINLKQDALDGTTDLTVKDLTSNSINNATTITTDTITASGDILCDTLDGNVAAVDLTVSKNCDILGPRNSTESNAGCYIGHILTDDFGLNLVSNATGGSVINFTKPNTAHIGSIDFDNTNEVMGFVINAVSQLTLDGTTADFQSNAITTAATVQGDYMTCIQTLTTNDLDVNNNLVVTGDFTVDNTLHVDTANNRLGIGTTTPESTLQIVGARQGVPQTVGCHFGHSNGVNFGIELCSLSTASSGIDFTQPNSNRRGSIGYDNSTNIFTISTNNSQTQLTIQDGLLDAQDCDITTIGTISGNLNSTRGQLITYHGEESGSLNVGNYDFNYGNGATSDANFAPMMPCSVKLKKFTYIGGGGSNPNTATRYVFRAYIDGQASNIYAFVNFNDETHSNITRHKFCNKFSSSSTSQVDLTDAQATLTDSGAGIQISWRTITKTSGSTDNKHRFGWIVETIEDL